MLGFCPMSFAIPTPKHPALQLGFFVYPSSLLTWMCHLLALTPQGRTNFFLKAQAQSTALYTMTASAGSLYSTTNMAWKTYIYHQHGLAILCLPTAKPWPRYGEGSSWALLRFFTKMKSQFSVL